VAFAAPLAWIGGLLPVLVAWFAHRRELLGRERGELPAQVEPVLRSSLATA